MNDNQVAIEIIGDASRVAPATELATTDVRALSETIAALSASMEAMGTVMVESMAKVEAAAARAASSVKKVGEGGFMAGISEGVEKALGPLNRMMAFLPGIGEAVMAAFAVEAVHAFAESVAKAAEQARHTAEMFGMTVEQVHELNAVALATGLPMDMITRGMVMMDRSMANAARGSKQLQQAWGQMGVGINDGLSQMEKFEKVADRFKNMDDGPKKAALAMQLFGRSGAAMIPILNMGADGIKRVVDKARELGVANTELSRSAQASGEALAESINVSKIAYQGLTNILTTALGPSLQAAFDGFTNMVAAMVKSYETGGIVKTVVEALKGALELVGEVISALCEVVASLWDAFKTAFDAIMQLVNDAFGNVIPEGGVTVRNVFNMIIDIIKIAVSAFTIFVTTVGTGIAIAADELHMFAKIAVDALTGHWGAVIDDWRNGCNQIAVQAENASTRIVAAAKTAIGAWDNLAGGGKDGWWGSGGGGFKLGRGEAGGGDPEIGPTGGGKHKKGGDDRVAQWREQLQDMLLQEQHWGDDVNQTNLTFWQHILATEKLSAKQRLEVQREINKARLALFKEGQQDQIAAIKENEAVLVDQAKTEAALSKIGLEERIAHMEDEVAAGRMTSLDMIAQRNVMNKAIYALDLQQAEAENKIRVDALNKEAALDHTTPQRKRQIALELVQIHAEYLNKVALLNAQAHQKEMADEQKLLDSKRQLYQKIFQPFTENLSKVLTLQQGFMTSIQNMWTGVASIVQQAVQKMIESWLVGLATKEATEQSQHMKSMLRTAKEAAGNAFAAVAKIPIIGPVLAPAAAIAAFAGVMAFSAKGGDDETSDGLYHLHEKEMVLPADLAQGVRSMVGASKGNTSAANENSGGGRGLRTGDIHYHDHTGTLTPDSIHNNRAAVARAVITAHREGHFVGVKGLKI